MPKINGKQSIRVDWEGLYISQEFFKFVLLEGLLRVINLNNN